MKELPEWMLRFIRELLIYTTPLKHHESERGKEEQRKEENLKNHYRHR